MSVGLPGLVNNVMIDAIEHIGKVVVAAGRLFGHNDPVRSPAEHTNQILFGTPPAAPAAPPPPPADDSGMHTGASDAGHDYTAGADAAELTDQKLAEMLKHIFASNQAARDKVSAILTEITTKQKQIAPEMGDPASVSAFGQFLDQKFAEVQKVLADARVDAKTQAAILDALGDEYRSTDPQRRDGGDTPPPAAQTEGADTSADTAPVADPTTDETATPLTDPLAGMGIGTPAAMEPLSAMGPALAGLSALPGAMGGLAGGGPPLDALGALGQLGALAGRGFTDTPPEEPGKPKDDFSDKPTDTDPKSKPPTADPADALHDDHHDPGQAPTTDQTHPTAPHDTTPAPPAPHDAAPASAPAPGSADPARTVTLPDGRVVTAPDDKVATAMRSVLTGTSVPDAFRAADLPIPPPGTPVLDPADPSHLDPGSLAQFASRDPVLAMGDGKIWLDGQLQPLGALGSSSDFLGWSKPPIKSSPQPAAATPPPPAPAS